MKREKKLLDPCNIKEIRAMLDLIDRTIAYRRELATLTGSVQAGLMLSQALYWQERAVRQDGWWYKTIDAWEEETGLSRREQETARKKSRKYLHSELRDVPARLYYKIDREALRADLMRLHFTDEDPQDLDPSGKPDRAD
jgi:hypothetical protein